MLAKNSEKTIEYFGGMMSSQPKIYKMNRTNTPIKGTISFANATPLDGDILIMRHRYFGNDSCMRRSQRWIGVGPMALHRMSEKGA
jgi:hypothetical protein